MRGVRTLNRLVAVLLLIGLGFQGAGRLPAAAQEDQRYFAESGFRVDNDLIWTFFSQHGGTRAFGLPISRPFRLLGYPAQLFQRHLLQLTETGEVRVVSLLDSGWMPYRQIAGMVLPPYDPAVTGGAPSTSSERYVEEMLDFVKSYLLDEVDGYPTNFFRMFAETIGPLDPTEAEPVLQSIAILQNLNVWGIPTSRPMRDPTAPGVISVRVERGVFRFDAACRCTSAIPLGTYFRSVLTGNELPLDLEQQAPDSPYLRQYDIPTHAGPYRPWALPGTDLNYAFLPSLEYPPASALQPTQAPMFAATSTPVGAPTATATAVPVPAGAPAAAPPAPFTVPAPISRHPRDIVLQSREAGPEVTTIVNSSDENERAVWHTVRFVRDRNPETSGLGPNVIHNRVYVARTVDQARLIYGDEAGVRNFPEAIDRYGGWFFLDRPGLGEEEQVLGSCEEDGCNSTRFQIHLRLLFRKQNVVSVFYTFGDQVSSSLPDVVHLAQNVSARMAP